MERLRARTIQFIVKKASSNSGRYHIPLWLALLIAACGGGSGSSPPLQATGTLTISGCSVPIASASCDSQISWSSNNATSPTVSVDGVVVASGNNGNVTTSLPGTFVDVVLSDGATTLDQLTVRGVCQSASAWDGALCTQYANRVDARASTPFLENGVAVELEVVLLQPLGSGPYPTVMFNHGSTGDGSDSSQFSRTFVSETVAKFFVDRGWMVAFPQRRGRGQSDGLYDEGFNADRSFYSCEQAVTLAGAERALEDLDAAVDWLRQRSDVDTTRMLVSGQSRGGVLSLAHAANRSDVFLGAINFVGGWLGEGCGDHAAVNASLFADGAAFPVDTLWLYAENDSFYSVNYSRNNFAAYTNAGGVGTFNVYTRDVGLNGHFLINSPTLWGADVDAYLDAR